MNLSPIFVINRDWEESNELLQVFPTLDLIPLRYGWRMKQAKQKLQQAGKTLVAGVGAIPSVAPETTEEQLVYRAVRDLFQLDLTPSQATGANVLSLPEKPVFVDMV